MDEVGNKWFYVGYLRGGAERSIRRVEPTFDEKGDVTDIVHIYIHDRKITVQVVGGEVVENERVDLSSV